MERVWDYPRPPAIVACERRARVELGGELVADSAQALRVLETSHPPTVYIPPGDVRLELLRDSNRRSSFCEFKGHAHYLDAVIGEHEFPAVAWTYRNPSGGYELLRDHLAFYPARVEAAWLDDEQVDAQESTFYGGWVTSDLVGPFKGPPGTTGW